MKKVLSIIEKPVDKALDTTSEIARSLTHEAWQYAAQVTNISSVLLLGFLYKPAVNNYIQQKHRIRYIEAPEPTSSGSPFASIIKPIKTNNEKNLIKKFNKEYKQEEDSSASSQFSRKQFPNTENKLVMSANSKEIKKAKSLRLSALVNSMDRIENDPGPTDQEPENPAGGNVDILKMIESGNIIKRRTLGRAGQFSENKLNNSSDSKLKRTQKKEKSSGLRIKRSYSEPQITVPRSEDINLASENDDFSGKQTTGLLEDLRIFQLTIIEWFTSQIRWLWHSIFDWFSNLNLFSFSLFFIPFSIICGIFFYLKSGFLFIKNLIIWIFQLIFNPTEILKKSGVDTRTKQNIINRAGYPYESYDVTTEDGYIITLERLPNVNSKQVVYFQHGVIDSGFTWLASGNATSIAMAAYDRGFDVFLGNFRGTHPINHVNPSISSATYWDFNVNHHAMKDIPAFIDFIKKLKEKEAKVINEGKKENLEVIEEDDKKKEDINLVMIAHSMGGMATLMFLVHCGMNNINHGLSKVVLLSPAGLHFDSPPLAKIGAPLIDYGTRFIPFIHTFRFSELIRVITTKIFEDVKSTNPTRDLFTYFVAALIGGSITNHSLNRVNVVRWVFTGTPIGVIRHFRQLISSGKFLAYDYGKKRNIIEYGSPEPTNFLNHYDKINIPVYFMMGLVDNLIRPANVIAHFAALQKVHPDLAFLRAFGRAGHVDFTLGVSEEMSNVILNCLEDAVVPNCAFHTLSSKERESEPDDIV